MVRGARQPAFLLPRRSGWLAKCSASPAAARRSARGAASSICSRQAAAPVQQAVAAAAREKLGCCLLELEPGGG
jgi:hypothetical protein